MLAKEIKPGTVVNHNDAPYMIESVNVQSPSAPGGAGGPPGPLSPRREVTFMFADNETVHFLDSGDYNQYSVARADVANELQYLTEGLEGMLALVYNGECVGVQLPAAGDLKVTQCDPAIKGNFATARTQPATLEPGLI